MSARGRRHFARKDVPSDPETDFEESEEVSDEESGSTKQLDVVAETANVGFESQGDAAASFEPESESGSGSESESASESQSESESESESDAPQISRPKFVRKTKQPTKGSEPADTKQSTLELIERTVRAETQLKHAVDDTDGLDPEAEYSAWKKRAQARAQRELDRLAAAEQEYEARELARELDAKRRKTD